MRGIVLSGITFSTFSLLLVSAPFLTQIIIIEMHIGIDGCLDLRMPQAFLDIAGIPPGFDKLSSMTVPQQMCMKGDATFPTVVPKQPLHRFTIEWPSVGATPPLVLGILFENDKQVVGIKGML